MKSKLNIITSLFTLTLTTFLLICIVTAWYVTNEEATATGMIGSVDSEGIDFIETKIYYLNSYNGNAYTSGEAITRSGDIPGVSNGDITGTTILRDFDNEDNKDTDIDESITAALVVVEYEIESDTNVNYTVNLATDFEKVITTEDSENLSLFQHNRLSNVVEVFSVDVNQITPNYSGEDITSYSNISYNTESPRSFTIDIDNNKKNTSIEIGNIVYDSSDANSKKNGYFYFIIDYNDNYINLLYDEMLDIFGNKADLTTPILFSTDLYITAI